MSHPRAQPSTKAAGRPPVTAWLWSHRFLFTYIALGAWFVLRIAQFHDVRTGFTSLEVFGDYFAPQRITQLRDLRLSTYRHSNGYDGQFYAQIAVAGNPFDPELRTALDAPAYRMRRILLPELAHLAGLGRPATVLAAYALSNVVCWVILAWITARWWFRPTSFENLLRWVGTMFGAGVLVSATRSLTDGPSLLVLAMGMRCLELNRRWLAAAVLGAAGLVRETSVLAASAFVSPKPPAPKSLVQGVLHAAICMLPAILWIGILAAHYGTLSGNQVDVGVLTFLKECHTIYSTLRARGLAAARDDIYVVVALLVQLGFVLGRPRPAMAWWRVGAAFALIPFFFGWAFWDDALDGVPRTVLPLTLAFNVLAPSTRGGRVLLLAGNLTVLSAPRVLDVVPTEQTTFVNGITCDYAAGWYQTEHLGRRTWRWASASSVLKVHNPKASSLPVIIEFDVQSRTERTLTLYAADVRQVILLRARHGIRAHFGPFELPPGDTSVGFDTTEPPWTEPGPHGRALSFSVQALQITPVEPPN